MGWEVVGHIVGWVRGCNLGRAAVAGSFVGEEWVAGGSMMVGEAGIVVGRYGVP